MWHDFCSIKNELGPRITILECFWNIDGNIEECIFIPVYGALEIIPVKTKIFQKAHPWPLPLTCSECNHHNPGFPSSGSKHISQVFIYQDPCVKSMKVRLVHGTCVEIKEEGIYSLPRGEGQTEHLCTAAVTASAMLDCLWPILCFFFLCSVL